MTWVLFPVIITRKEEEKTKQTKQQQRNDACDQSKSKKIVFSSLHSSGKQSYSNSKLKPPSRHTQSTEAQELHNIKYYYFEASTKGQGFALEQAPKV